MLRIKEEVLITLCKTYFLFLVIKIMNIQLYSFINVYSMVIINYFIEAWIKINESHFFTKFFLKLLILLGSLFIKGRYRSLLIGQKNFLKNVTQIKFQIDSFSFVR